MSVLRAWSKLPDYLLGSRVSTWLVPRMVLWVASSSLCFTGMISLPMWGLMWMCKHATCTILWSAADRRWGRASRHALSHPIEL
jgi:hypothetical protein